MKCVLECIFVPLLISTLVSCSPLPDYKTGVVSNNDLGNILCEACADFVEGLRKLFESNLSEDLITDAAIELCKLKHIEDHYICSKIVPEFKDEVLTVFSKTALTSQEICGRVLGSKCGDTYNPFNQTWNISVPKGKPPVKPHPFPKPGAPVNRILQLSDIHWDTQYTPGLTTQCGEPLCCRPPNAKAKSSKDAAGLWGDVHCDIPYRTVVNLMEHLNEMRDEFDWVYVTGDLPAHNDWTQTRDDQLGVLSNITSLFRKYLPGKRVFFVMGNHESAPVNSFPPPYITGDQSESWLYNKAADEWADWLTPDAVQTLKYGGYYAVDVKPDLKVISLQTNFCSKNNWWLLINNTDPANMLQWLGDQLLESEKKGQKVHILGHIPSNDGPCMRSWSVVFHNLAYRFEDTVTGYFYGHVHTDKFYVFHAHQESKPRPFGVGYLAPSVTGNGFKTAGYRTYTIDGTYNGSSRTVLDHSTYIMNITQANLGHQPKWILEYSAKDAYNMSSLSPEAWEDLINRFETDDALFQKFNRYISKSSEENQCTGKCKEDVLCFLRRDRSYDTCTNSTLGGHLDSTTVSLFRGGNSGAVDVLPSAIQLLFGVGEC